MSNATDTARKHLTLLAMERETMTYMTDITDEYRAEVMAEIDAEAAAAWAIAHRELT